MENLLGSTEKKESKLDRILGSLDGLNNVLSDLSSKAWKAEERLNGNRPETPSTDKKDKEPIGELEVIIQKIEVARVFTVRIKESLDNITESIM